MFTNAPTSIKYSGLSFTKVPTSVTKAGTTIYVYYLLNPPIGTFDIEYIPSISMSYVI